MLAQKTKKHPALIVKVKLDSSYQTTQVVHNTTPMSMELPRAKIYRQTIIRSSILETTTKQQSEPAHEKQSSCGKYVHMNS